MGELVMVLGKSGSGKSTSLRGFEDGEAGIFNVTGKPLPFRKRLRQAVAADYGTIGRSIGRNGLRAYVVDDATYLMAFDNFDKAGEQGYGKFVAMAKSFYGLLKAAMATDADTVCYFMMHPELDAAGCEKPRTVGRMLDEKLCVEGLFSVVLDCVREPVPGGGCAHRFVWQGGPESLAKAPEGMFPPGPMDNDLKAVDAAIREYRGMKPLRREQEA